MNKYKCEINVRSYAEVYARTQMEAKAIVQLQYTGSRIT